MFMRATSGWLAVSLVAGGACAQPTADASSRHDTMVQPRTAAVVQPQSDDGYAEQLGWLTLLRSGRFAELDQRATRAHDDYLRHRSDGPRYWRQFSLFCAIGRDDEAALDGWVAHEPESGVALLARSLYRTHIAFLERGDDTRRTSTEQFVGMTEYLLRAEQDADLAALRLRACPLCVPAHLIRESASESQTTTYRAQAITELQRYPDLWRLVVWIDASLSPNAGGSYDAMTQFSHWLSVEFPTSSLSRLSRALTLNDMARAAAARHEDAASARLVDRSLATYPTVDALTLRIAASAKRLDIAAVQRDIGLARAQGELDLGLLDTVGSALAQIGLVGEAEQEFQRVLRLDADDRIARAEIEQLIRERLLREARIAGPVRATRVATSPLQH
jgi:hypothetical protein